MRNEDLLKSKGYLQKRKKAKSYRGKENKAETYRARK
jgi:hypothetical protein